MILPATGDAKLLDFGGPTSLGEVCWIEYCSRASTERTGERNASGGRAAEAGGDGEIII